jgi:hypothetical protein
MRLTFFSLAAILSAHALVFAQPPTHESRTVQFAHVDTERAYQEVLTVMRQVAGAMPEPPGDRSLHTVTLTGSADQLAIAEWIVKELDGTEGELAQPGPRRAPQQRQLAAGGKLVDIVYLDSAAKPMEIQEVITTLRQVADVNHIFDYSPRAAIVFQAPPEQVRLAEWLVSTIEKTPSAGKDQRASTDEYRMPGPNEDITRVFHWDSALTPPEVRQLVHTIRTDAKVMKAFTYFRTNSLAVRGTAAQLEMVSELVAGPPSPK